MSDELERAEVEAVLRRAAELDAAEATGGDRVDAGALIAAAKEAGLSERAIETALAELRAGHLVTQPPRGLDRLGPSGVAAERSVALPLPLAQARIAEFLSAQWFTEQRRSGDTVRWAAREGVLADLRRDFDFANTLVLGKVRQLLVTVTADEGRTRVRLEADLTAHRRGTLTGFTAPPAGVGAAVAALGLLAGIEAAVVAVPLGVAGAAGGWFAARQSYTRRRQRIHDALERMLDELTRR